MCSADNQSTHFISMLQLPTNKVPYKGIFFSVFSVLSTGCSEVCDIFDQPVRCTKFHELLVIYESFCSWMAKNLIHNCNFDHNPKYCVLTASASEKQKLRNFDIFPKHWPKKWFSIKFWHLRCRGSHCQPSELWSKLQLCIKFVAIQEQNES